MGKDIIKNGNGAALLSPRLKAAGDFCGKCGCFADIGTDHGLLPVYVILSGKAGRAIASDLREGPLKNCRANVASYGLGDKISIRRGNGFESIGPGEADTAAICGMGGMLICEIIASAVAEGRIKKGTRLILGPNTHDEYVRRLLYLGPFGSIREKAVRDSGRIYLVISCIYNGGDLSFDPSSDGLCEAEFFINEHFTGREAGLPKYYYKKALDKALKRYEGIKNMPACHELEILESLIPRLRELAERRHRSI